MQVTEIIENIINQENGFNKFLQMGFEALMKSERTLHNNEYSDLSNGYLTRKVFGDKEMFELWVSRTRNENFYPVILGVLKNQQQEARNLVFSLYSKWLTTEQVGETFELLYGKKYSTLQVSRMFDDAPTEVLSNGKRFLKTSKIEALKK